MVSQMLLQGGGTKVDENNSELLVILEFLYQLVSQYGLKLVYSMDEVEFSTSTRHKQIKEEYIWLYVPRYRLL